MHPRAAQIIGAIHDGHHESVYRNSDRPRQFLQVGHSLLVFAIVSEELAGCLAHGGGIEVAVGFPLGNNSPVDVMGDDVVGSHDHVSLFRSASASALDLSRRISETWNRLLSTARRDPWRESRAELFVLGASMQRPVKRAERNMNHRGCLTIPNVSRETIQRSTARGDCAWRSGWRP